MMASMAGARASTGEAGEATSQDDVANDVDADDNTDGQWMTTEEVGAAEIAIMPLGYTGGKRPADGPTRLANGVPDSEAESPKKRKYTKKVKAPSSYPCGRCDMEVADGEEAILCEQKCFKWFHRPCAGAFPVLVCAPACSRELSVNKQVRVMSFQMRDFASVHPWRERCVASLSPVR